LGIAAMASHNIEDDCTLNITMKIIMAIGL